MNSDAKFRITSIESIRGGSCCSVFKCLGQKNTKKYSIIIKFCGEGLMTRLILPNVVRDYLNVRQKTIRTGVKVPRLYGFILRDTNIYSEDEVIPLMDLKTLCASIKKVCYLGIIEEYTGTSIRDSIMDNTLSINSPLLGAARSFIRTLPTDIPLDTNPGNITVQGNALHFIDFIPPDPWKYRQDKKIRHDLEAAFPTTRPLWDDDDKKKRYFDSESRVTRFNYYLNKVYMLSTQPNFR